MSITQPPTGSPQASTIALLSLVALAIPALVPLSPAQAQSQAQTQFQSQRYQETNGRNVDIVYHRNGHFETRGDGRWTEYDANGRAIFNFRENNRDDWSVYLRDRSRNVRLQLDLHRKWVRYAQGRQSYSDLYRLTGAEQRRVRGITPPPPRRQTRLINAGPIWNTADADVKCPVVAFAVDGVWTGTWKTTEWGRMSVCEIDFAGIRRDRRPIRDPRGPRPQRDYEYRGQR